MVLLHGIQDFALSLDGLARAFAADFHVLSYDLRGHGDSDKPGVYTVSHHLADLHSVVRQLDGRRPVLVGHSLGGQIATQYAGIFEETPACVVSIDGLGPPMRDVDLPVEHKRGRARRGIESLLRREKQGRPMKSLDQAVRLYRQNHAGLSAEHARLLVTNATQPHADGGLRWKWDRRVLLTFLSFAPPLTEERWSWVRCPVLMITGGRSGEFWSRRRSVSEEDSRLDPEELERRLSCFKDVTHVEIADAGHMIHYDAPEQLRAEIAAFLEARINEGMLTKEELK